MNKLNDEKPVRDGHSNLTLMVQESKDKPNDSINYFGDQHEFYYKRRNTFE